LRDKALDRRGFMALVKSLAICAVVITAHHYMASIGPFRLAVDALLYGVLMLALGVLAPRDLKAVLKMVKDRKKAASA
jgi:hypothetical protein